MPTPSQIGMILADHDRAIQVVVVDCVACGAQDKKECSHALTDLQIKRKCFPAWAIKGLWGALSTKCPNCRRSVRAAVKQTEGG